MHRTISVCLPALALSFALVLQASAQDNDIMNPAPTAADWASIAKLPDLSGVWLPDIKDQTAQETSNQPPWNPKAKAAIEGMIKDEDEGKPHGLFVNCLPQGTPTWMAITHNVLEFLLTPGRVTILGESDGNSMRRIYTDGRGHPEDPDLTFAGHSIGHWEGGTLVVDTVGIHPQVLLAISEASGVPNNGDMHVVERIRLISPNVIADEMEITAPHILTKPWKTTRKFFRQRGRSYDIIGGVCVEGNFAPTKDADGNDVFVPRKYSFSE